MDGDGTIRYSTGRPGRENADATPTLPDTLTAAQSIDAASAAIVSRFPEIFTPTPNVLKPVAYSKRGEFCENPKLPVSRLTADTELKAAWSFRSTLSRPRR